MLYVALASIGALVVVTISFAGVIRWGIRQHAREREQLVNQVCYLSGRTWQDPPSFTSPALEIPPDEAWTTPEQMAV